uniref:Uncharacterized protein n=2 Tax=Opuntia streptacantha TaxID=393608 RepID=A0A7C8ZZ54_OPUST
MKVAFGCLLCETAANECLGVFCNLALPVISTRTRTIFEMMVSIHISHNNFSGDYLANELESSMTVHTNPKILLYSNGRPQWSCYESKSNGKLFTVVEKQQLLFTSFNIMQIHLKHWGIACFYHKILQFIQFCINFITSGMAFISNNESMDLIFHFNPTHTGFFLHLIFLHQLPHF